MKKLFTTIIAILFALAFSIDARSSSNDFYAIDPNATYDKSFTNIEVVIEIPGYKLDPPHALSISIGEKEYKYAQNINPEILEKANQYIKNKKLNSAKDYSLYAAKDLGDYVLLYFREPNIMDGGFELIYSKGLNSIIGTFVAGYKG
ncbi:MAG: hypothetical protein KKF54_05650 [Candidatus Omnitrophica bacterium]|nr:hypothetical protein [Candidatus Omnitrophota bacterium]